MRVFVKGVPIDLNDEQVKTINDKLKEIDDSCKTFESALKSYGFKKMSTLDWENPDQNCWSHVDGWFANIVQHPKYNSCILYGDFINGAGKHGMHFDEVEDLLEAIRREIDNKQNK